MATPLEDYALIGDLQTAALVSRDGSIDWLCLPRFDGGACFASILGGPEHGRWLITPESGARPTVRRRYRHNTLVLETELTTADGTVRVVDFMPPRNGDPEIVRLVEGVSGRVPLRMELIVRFDYGRTVPWVRRGDGLLHLVAGPDSLILDTPVPTHGEGLTTVAKLTVDAGDRVPFVLSWHPSHHEPRHRPQHDADDMLADTEAWWTTWAEHSNHRGRWADAVNRSLLTLKSLTYEPTGGIVAAPTASLPEKLGGVRNWDYRYCWLRDATMTLDALLAAGYEAEAQAWRDWLLRAVAGSPEQLQIMYGVAGERRLTEVELDWLPGYEGSRPVRIGNAAVTQPQIDVYGEVMDTLHEARIAGIHPDAAAWNLQQALMESLESHWTDPDNGIWEIRTERRHFTYSKIMAWVAADRAVKAVDRFGRDGPRDRWAALRDTIHEEVCAKGYDSDRGTFTQYYGSRGVDASLLLIPQLGFLPPSDPRVTGTVTAVERELCEDGFVHRYSQADEEVDGLPPGEGTFLACSFWLADAYTLLGRRDTAVSRFERLLDLRNDVGLLSEQYDPKDGRLLGNHPQAFSHVALVNTACLLTYGTSARGESSTDRASSPRQQ